jgi:type IV pilus assembly protein PilQ
MKVRILTGTRILVAASLCVCIPTGARCERQRLVVQDTIVVRDIELESVPAGIALRSIARLYGLNVSVEEGLDVPITLHLKSAAAAELFNHLRGSYALEIDLLEGIWHIRRTVPDEREERLQIEWAEGNLILDATAVRLDQLGEELAREGVLTLLPGNYADRRVSGYVTSPRPESGVRALLRSHGLRLVREDIGVYLVRELAEDADQAELELLAEGDFVTFRLVNASLERVLRELARVLNWNIFFYGEVAGDVTATAEMIPATRALELLLVGTGLGVRLQDESLLIGDARLMEFGEVRLLKLEHLKVEGLIERLPAYLTEEVALQPIPEQNGVMASGATSALNAVEAFINTIDQPVAQILFEALVVDYLDEVGSEVGLELGVGPPRDSLNVQSFFPKIDVEGRGSWFKTGLEVSLSDNLFNLPVVGELPDDFYIRLKALEREGKVRIQSRPQLATINGNPATLTVGTTQYFLIRSETTFAQQTVQTRISEQFETIEANMSLEITPWVTTSGEIITKIRPEFNTPQGTFNSEVPPTINHRIVDTTVQLRDGETIILGGLVQETTRDEERRFPLLWRLPLLGKLFVSKMKLSTTSEMMIYLTPHIYTAEMQNQPPPDGGGGL